ncbi:MAG: hypothetical protein Q8P73_03645 [bacterium]|nr:hypothetical protein [bacterium]
MQAKVTEKQKARVLRSQGKSLNEIVHLVNVSKSSISVWVRDIQLKPKHIERLRQRQLEGIAKSRPTLNKMWAEYHKLHPKPEPKGPRWPKRDLEHFFDEWAPNMAYVLGFFAADGTMYKNKRGSCYIGFCSVEREQIELIKKLINAGNQIESYQPHHGNRQKRHTLQIGSKMIYQRLINLGFTPNKSLTMKYPNIPNEVLGDFVRGYLDGDGCVSFNEYYYPDRKKIRRWVTIRFVCGSKSFLADLAKQLHQQAGVNLVKAPKSGRAYRISYSTNDSRQLRKLLYPNSTVPCMPRKRNKLEMALKIIGPVA